MYIIDPHFVTYPQKSHKYTLISKVPCRIVYGLYKQEYISFTGMIKGEMCFFLNDFYTIYDITLNHSLHLVSSLIKFGQ